MVYLLQPIDLPLNFPQDPYARWWQPPAQAAWPPAVPPYPQWPPQWRRQDYPQQPLAGPSTSKAVWVQPPPLPPAHSAHALYVPDIFSVPELEPPSSPSDISASPISTASTPTPAPEFVHVVCNAPLIAPKPLPYRSPAFLESFELPDPDEDLSHPPYTPSRTSKRKRAREEDDSDSAAPPAPVKRRITEPVLRGLPTMPLNGLASQRRFTK
ncbi:hypothetical protein BV25DRAFT_1915374 [Artomyces pyxidatus]|uniref:Uncharacterized protein n=1 Tax=Artomyces pyxidatus TaxID=48021 RepID=A0ACB8T3Z3_9AGAM|nr:hypothetical protein BV25DRAFT_1915374 [Artomyces pyxidatus]